MELRSFRYFLAVAEELHFARAAERLHMAQPPLSRQIRALERELGVVLFHRTKRKVELTGAGMVLLGAARKVLEQADRAVAIAQRAGRGEIGHLDLAYTSTMPYTALFPTVIREYRRALPGVQLGLHEMTTGRQLKGLLDGRVDVGFIRLPVRDCPKSIELTPILREPFLVALRDDHPLAQATAIKIEVLANERLVLGGIGSGLFNQVDGLCRRAGFEPHVVQAAQQLAAVIALVAAGVGISIVPQSAKHLAVEEVVYRPLSTASDQAEVAIACRRNESSSAIHAFVTLTIDLAHASRVERPSAEIAVTSAMVGSQVTVLTTPSDFASAPARPKAPAG